MPNKEQATAATGATEMSKGAIQSITVVYTATTCEGCYTGNAEWIGTVESGDCDACGTRTTLNEVTTNLRFDGDTLYVFTRSGMGTRVGYIVGADLSYSGRTNLYVRSLWSEYGEPLTVTSNTEIWRVYYGTPVQMLASSF